MKKITDAGFSFLDVNFDDIDINLDFEDIDLTFNFDDLDLDFNFDDFEIWTADEQHQIRTKGVV